jgi:antitoxin component YwqK of YwqJK toxin-antitoxin module
MRVFLYSKVFILNMKIIITEEQKKKLFIPRKLSDNDSRYSDWNNKQPIIDGKRINQLTAEGRKQGYWEYYHNNGKLNIKGSYIKGKKDGIWEEYHNNGVLESKGNYVNGKREGYWEEYHRDGTLRFKGNYKNDNGDGYWERYYGDGNLVYKGSHINGLRDGYWETYWSTGKLEHKGNYKNGKRDGLWKWYYSNGNLMNKELYNNGELVIRLPLTESEQPKKKLFIPRKLSGEGSRWEQWNNSQPIINGKPINQYDGEGRKQGYWEHNANDDEYKRSGSYINDKKVGVWEWYYDDGQLWYKGLFVNDKMEGIWEFYDENGKLFNKKLFKNGIWKDIPITESEQPKKKLFIPRKLSGEDNRYTEWNTQQPTITLDNHTFKLNQYDQNGNKIGIWLDKPELINQNYSKTKAFMENLFNNLNVVKSPTGRNTNYKLNNKIIFQNRGDDVLTYFYNDFWKEFREKYNMFTYDNRDLIKVWMEIKYGLGHLYPHQVI